MEPLVDEILARLTQGEREEPGPGGEGGRTGLRLPIRPLSSPLSAGCRVVEGHHTILAAVGSGLADKTLGWLGERQQPTLAWRTQRALELAESRLMIEAGTGCSDPLVVVTLRGRASGRQLRSVQLLRSMGPLQLLRYREPHPPQFEQPAALALRSLVPRLPGRHIAPHNPERRESGTQGPGPPSGQSPPSINTSVKIRDRQDRPLENPARVGVGLAENPLLAGLPLSRPWS